MLLYGDAASGKRRGLRVTGLAISPCARSATSATAREAEDNGSPPKALVAGASTNPCGDGGAATGGSISRKRDSRSNSACGRAASARNSTTDQRSEGSAPRSSSRTCVVVAHCSTTTSSTVLPAKRFQPGIKSSDHGSPSHPGRSGKVT